MSHWPRKAPGSPDLEVKSSIPAISAPQDKLKSVAELGNIASQARGAGRTTVLCHGVFDLFHVGHVRHLKAARREGDLLIVTLTADKHVNKGPGRPVFTERLRAEMIAALEFVDFVGI